MRCASARLVHPMWKLLYPRVGSQLAGQCTLKQNYGGWSYWAHRGQLHFAGGGGACISLLRPNPPMRVALPCRQQPMGCVRAADDSSMILQRPCHLPGQLPAAIQ